MCTTEGRKAHRKNENGGKHYVARRYDWSSEGRRQVHGRSLLGESLRRRQPVRDRRRQDQQGNAEDQRRGCLQLRPGAGCSAAERGSGNGAGDPDARVQLKREGGNRKDAAFLSEGGEALAKAERLYTDQVHGRGFKIR